MTIFQSIAALLTVTAVFSYLNHRYLHLPVTIGVMVIAVLSSLGLSVTGNEMPLIYCLLFGALISPTDPIAVMGIMRTTGAWLFCKEAIGGAIFGYVIGYVAYRMLRSIDQYQVEITITLALVTGGYAFAKPFICRPQSPWSWPVFSSVTSAAPTG